MEIILITIIIDSCIIVALLLVYVLASRNPFLLLLPVICFSLHHNNVLLYVACSLDAQILRKPN